MLASNDMKILMLALVVGVATVGCKKASKDTQSLDPAGGAPGDVDDPLAELDRLEREMVRLGLRAETPAAPAGVGEGAGMQDGDVDKGAEAEMMEESEPAPIETTVAPAPPKAEVQHCFDVCDLSAAICDLEARICSLSDGHDGDPTYADACRRASEDCELAARACDGCGG